MYLVSILVPVFGVEKYIERCAISLFEQTYENIEYVFVDDCSKDKSIDILKDVIKRYPERIKSVRIIRHEYNRGLAAARNTAIANANGIFVCHVDSDDYMDKNAIALLVDKQLESNADIVSGNAVKLLPSKRVDLIEPRYKNKDEMLVEMLRMDSVYNHVLWKRIIRLSLYRDNCISTIEGYNQGEDWQVMPKLVYFSEKVSSIDRLIYYYNCTNENSYCNLNNGENISSWSQNVGSVKEMALFFSTKESKYSKEANDVAITTMNCYLHMSAKYKKKDFFNTLCKDICSLYKSNFQSIGWDNPLIKFVGSNYHIRSAYARFRSFVWKIVKSLRPCYEKIR